MDTGVKYCALSCEEDTDCPKKATCKDLGRDEMICTYDDATPATAYATGAHSVPRQWPLRRPAAGRPSARWKIAVLDSGGIELRSPGCAKEGAAGCPMMSAAIKPR